MKKTGLESEQEDDKLPQKTDLEEEYKREMAERYRKRLASMENKTAVEKHGGVEKWDASLKEANHVLENRHLYDQKKIEQAEYAWKERKKFLRKNAVSPELRDWVKTAFVPEDHPRSERVNLEGPKMIDDEKKIVEKGYSADHLVSFDEITEMEGFRDLGLMDQIGILRNAENFQPLEKGVNSSKRDRRYLMPGEDPDQVDHRKVWVRFKGEPITNEPMYQEQVRQYEANKRFFEEEIKHMLEKEDRGDVQPLENSSEKRNEKEADELERLAMEDQRQNGQRLEDMAKKDDLELAAEKRRLEENKGGIERGADRERQKKDFEIER